MKLTIDRQTGNSIYSTAPGYLSNKMFGFGCVDRVHQKTGAVWNPGWEMVESYLEGMPPEDIPLNITGIEGRYLIVYRDAGHIFIFCDRYCLSRIYYRLTSTSLELFDQILGEVSNLQINEPEALAFLMFRFLPGRKTLFNQIYQLMGGECLVLDCPTGRFHAEISSPYPQKNLPPLDYPEAGQKFHALFRGGIEARLKTYSPTETLLIPLSGGFDSRYMLSTLLELVSPSRIQTFTFGASGSYDFENGQKIARVLGVQNTAFLLSDKTFSKEGLVQICADTNAQIDFSREFPLDFFYRMAEHGRVIFSGNPGNSITGQWIPSLAHFHDQHDIVAADLLLPAGDPLGDYVDQQILEDSFTLFNSPGRPSLFQPELWILSNRLPKYLNLCAYRMRQHFQYISPFYDYDWVDFLLNLPIEMRFERKLYLYWIAKHFPEVAKIPCAFFNGVPLTASRPRKYIAKQWDRVSRRILKVNRRVNKIDWDHYAGMLLDVQKLGEFAKHNFSPEIKDLIFRSSSRNTLLYSLKSLEVLLSNWEVEFTKTGSSSRSTEMHSLAPSI